MQSFKPTLNRCKALFYSFYRLGKFPSLSSSPPSYEVLPPHCIPPVSPAVPACRDCGHTEATRAARTCQPPGTKGKAFPPMGSPSPAWVWGGSCTPQLLLRRHFAFCWVHCCVLRFLSWACKARWAAPWANPAHLGQHTGFVKTPPPTDVYCWSSHYHFPSTYWHDKLSIYRVNNHQINGL